MVGMDNEANQMNQFSKFAVAEGSIQAVDLNSQIARFRRRAGVFWGVVTLVMAAAIFITFSLTPRFTALAQIMLENRQAKVVDTEQVLGGVLQGGMSDTAVVDTQVQVVESRNIAEKVVSDLKLDSDGEFNKMLRPKSFIDNFIPRPDINDNDYAHTMVVDSVMKRTKVTRGGLTYVINVAFESESADKAARIANAIADAYMALQINAKLDASSHASTWLHTKIDEMKGQVEAAETAVQKYKADHGLLGLTEAMGVTQTGAVSIGQTASQQELGNLDGQLALTRAQEAEAVARLNTAKSQIAHGSNGLDVGEALMSPVVQELRKQRAEVTGVIADLQGKYGPKHPELLKAQRQLTDLDKQIQGEVGRVTSNLEAQAQVAHQRTASILSSIGKARGALASGSAASVELNELERNAQAVRSLYQYYLDRYKQTSTQQGLERPDAQIVSRASEKREQSFPNVPLFLALGLVVAGGAGVAMVLFFDALESGVFTSEDVELTFGVPHIGSIPTAGSHVAGRKKMDPISDIIEHPLSGFAESFRNLKTSATLARMGEPGQVIGMTSSLPGEGKTTAAICLGRITALGGQKTVIVDCDLRRRTVNQIFASKPSVGLLEVLAGANTLDEALHFDEASGAYFLPLADAVFSPQDIFSSNAMDRLLEELRRRFEYVILDTAPVLAVADTKTLASKVDLVIFLAQWKKTPRKAIQNALRQLASCGAPVAGVVLTQVNLREMAKSGYGDALYYYGYNVDYYQDVDKRVGAQRA